MNIPVEHSRPKKGTKGSGALRAPALTQLVNDLQEIEDGSGSGTVEIPGGSELAVTNLGKIFFPRKKLTKGDLLRYYAATASLILPVMKDRPLVLKRFPNGVDGQLFFQQNAGDTPPGVRVETIETQGGSTNLRIVGGDLYTLLYTIQLGSISVDPWHAWQRRKCIRWVFTAGSRLRGQPGSISTSRCPPELRTRPQLS